MSEPSTPKNKTTTTLQPHKTTRRHRDEDSLDRPTTSAQLGTFEPVLDAE